MIRCGHIDLSWLKENRDQLWAEAYKRHQDGEPWWFETAELTTLARAEQAERYETGVWDETILKWIEDPHSSELGMEIESKQGRVTVDDILRHAVRKPIDHWTQKDKNAVVKCLKHAGWTCKVARKDGKHIKVYLRGDN